MVLKQGVLENTKVNGEILPHKWTAKMFHVKHFRPFFVFDSDGWSREVIALLILELFEQNRDPLRRGPAAERS
jgi:hypothetical protein